MDWLRDFLTPAGSYISTPLRGAMRPEHDKHKRGLVLPASAYRPIRISFGGREIFDEQLFATINSSEFGILKDILARIRRIESGDFLFELYVNGEERLYSSQPLPSDESISDDQAQSILDTLDKLRTLLNSETINSSRRQFIEQLSLPDRGAYPDFYRFYTGADGEKNLAIIWGVEAVGSTHRSPNLADGLRQFARPLPATAHSNNDNSTFTANDTGSRLFSRFAMPRNFPTGALALAALTLIVLIVIAGTAIYYYDLTPHSPLGIGSGSRQYTPTIASDSAEADDSTTHSSAPDTGAPGTTARPSIPSNAVTQPGVAQTEPSQSAAVPTTPTLDARSGPDTGAPGTTARPSIPSNAVTQPGVAQTEPSQSAAVPTTPTPDARSGPDTGAPGTTARPSIPSNAVIQPGVAQTEPSQSAAVPTTIKSKALSADSAQTVLARFTLTDISSPPTKTEAQTITWQFYNGGKIIATAAGQSVDVRLPVGEYVVRVRAQGPHSLYELEELASVSPPTIELRR